MPTDADSLAAARARMDAAKPAILAAWARRDADPYGLGLAVGVVLYDDTLFVQLGFDSPRHLLEAELPDVDVSVLTHDASIAHQWPRDQVERYTWDRIVPRARGGG